MFVLDTNVISELRQGKPNQSPGVRACAATQPSGRLFLSAITILELEKGVQALERRTPSQGSALRAWLTGVRAAFAGHILPFTEHTVVRRITGAQSARGARRHARCNGHRAWLHGGHAQSAGFQQHGRAALQSVAARD